MKKIDDGGAAFPIPDVFRPDGMHVSGGDPGMTLRQWYAGQALANPYTAHDSDPDKVAEWAVSVADALIAALKKGDGA